jgi:SM-20-related protein
MIASAIHINDQIADRLANDGWYVGESIFGVALGARLRDRAYALATAGKLEPARIGRNTTAQGQTDIRCDDTLWLADDPEDAAERDALVAVHALRTTLNTSLYVGARSAELHFARYAPGAFYRTHRDRFRDDDARVITLVFYLNDDWSAGSGGELVLYERDDSGAVLARVPPRAGTMVCFRSELFPHEVLPAAQQRFSLTGWLRRDERMTV